MLHKKKSKHPGLSDSLKTISLQDYLAKGEFRHACIIGRRLSVVDLCLFNIARPRPEPGLDRPHPLRQYLAGCRAGR
ncbi:hypothetical protein METHP14_30136 [Pseudomonas sp. P14-2025]